MTCKWESLPLGVVAEIIGGGTPGTKQPRYWDGEVPWITPKDLSNHNGVFISKGERFITLEGLNKSSAKLVPANSVLYTSRAPIGYVAINKIPVATNQGFKSLVPKAGFDYLYLYYLLKNSKKEVLAYASGGTFDEIGANAISQVKLPFPPVHVQRAIGTTLFDLDAKIEANATTVALLEEITQTVFKSWFIDFDPVHAKQKGEDPEGMDEETAALFPDSFEDSQLGRIPLGWVANSLGSYLVPKKGKVITESKTRPGFVPVVAGGLEPAYFHDTSNVNGPVITISSSGANAGFVRLYTEDVWASDCTYVSKVETENVYFWYNFLKSRQEVIWHVQQGGAQPHIYASDLMRLSGVFPGNSALIAKYEEIVASSFELIAAKARENRILKDLRDSLLPRLIGGGLEIPEDILGE
jgi:type I restriction enzyme S subunit